MSDKNCKSGITVIVPVYNSENVLHYCVDSIINQTYKDWYLILVDDGSIDNSGAICDEYALKYENISVIHKENGGVSSARNAGTDASETDYIVYVDCDDYVKENYLESLISIKYENPCCDNVWSTLITVFNYDDLEESTISNPTIELYNRKQLIDLLNLWYVQGPTCKLYSKRIIDEHKIRMNESIDLGEDLLFNLHYLDCVKNESIIVVDNKSYKYYRGANDSLDTKYRADFLDIQLMLRSEILKYMQKWNVDEEQFQKYDNSALSMFVSVFENTFKPGNKMSFFSKIKYNNCVMKTEAFKSALAKHTSYINPIVKIGFKLHNYYFIYAVFMLAKRFKHK